MAITNILRIRRRAAGGASGSPSSLYNAELAFNETDKILFYGFGDNGSNMAQSIISIGGEGAFVTLATEQTLSGTKTFTSNTIFDDIAVDGGDITSSSTVFNLLGQSSTINFGLAAAELNIGNAVGTTIINSANTSLGGTLTTDSNAYIGGLLSIGGDSLVSSSISFSLLDQPQILTFGTGASSLSIGADTGTTTINNTLVVSEGVIETSATEASIFDSNATSVYAFGSATYLRFASDTGTTEIGNDLNVYGNLFVGGNTLSVGSSTFSLVNTNATTVNAFGEASVISIGSTSGTTTINNALVVSGLSNLSSTIINGHLTVRENSITIGDASGGYSDDTAHSGGLFLKGSTDKVWAWNQLNSSWTSSENIDIYAGRTYKIDGVDVLSNTTLGSSVINSSLTKVGILSTGEWNADPIAAIYGGTGITSYVEGDMIYADTTTTLTKLTKGISGQMLQIDDTDNYTWTSRIDGGVYA